MALRGSFCNSCYTAKPRILLSIANRYTFVYIISHDWNQLPTTKQFANILTPFDMLGKSQCMTSICCMISQTGKVVEERATIAGCVQMSRRKDVSQSLSQLTAVLGITNVDGDVTKRIQRIILLTIDSAIEVKPERRINESTTHQVAIWN